MIEGLGEFFLKINEGNEHLFIPTSKRAFSLTKALTNAAEEKLDA